MENNGFYFKQTCPIVNEGIKEAIKGLKEILLIGNKIIPNLKLKSQQNGKKDIRTTMIVSLFKEALERVDGILILLEKHSALNATIILRSYVEIYHDLRVILLNTGRKMALYYFLDKNIELLEKVEASGDDITEAIRDIISFIENNFELNELKNINITKLKDIKNKIGNKQWWNFENNFKYKTSEDKLLYKVLCQEIHGENSIKDNFYNKESQFLLRPLRVPLNYELIFALVSTHMLNLVILLQEEFQLDKSYSTKIFDIFELSKSILNTPQKHQTR